MEVIQDSLVAMESDSMFLDPSITKGFNFGKKMDDWLFLDHQIEFSKMDEQDSKGNSHSQSKMVEEIGPNNFH